MADWNPEKYLQFKKQRTQPAIDLAKRVRKYNPKTVADIGCGPGNSTAVLRSVFPAAEILGIDPSEEMLERAKQEHPDLQFARCDAEGLPGKYDLLFSNACLQWIDCHETLIPKLMNKLNHNGHLAVQMPMNQDEPLFRIIREAAAEGRWNFETVRFEKNDTLTPEQYFDILSGCASEFDLWETVYYHPMPSHEHLLEWVRGSRLRPYLAVLSEDEKAEFEVEILRRVKEAYPIAASGEVVLKFRRFFFVAKKQAVLL